MISLARVFTNFKEFYSEINGATLTGAIDVVVVEQPDGSFLCSPFHVRFGKLGVLRSREKVVDIEINGEPVDIHMKLGDSGEAFFVEECAEDDLELLPENMATSPLPTNEFSSFNDSKSFVHVPEEIDIPKPRRNSIDLSTQDVGEVVSEIKFENQISDFSHRRHTDNTIGRRDLSATKFEYTTQKLREEWAANEEQRIFHIENVGDETEDWTNGGVQPIVSDANVVAQPILEEHSVGQSKPDEANVKEESKSKKKRRKKSIMKKKNTQRKTPSSSSAGSVQSDLNDTEVESLSQSQMSADLKLSGQEDSAKIESSHSSSVAEQIINDNVAVEFSKIVSTDTPSRLRELDIHFFSDTEITTGMSPRNSRPTTPIQSDTEFEITQREKNDDDNIMTKSASWKWGELPTQLDSANEKNSADSKQAQRNSMLSGMFSFMKQTKNMRQGGADGLYLSDLDAEGMDPEVAALYFPSTPVNNTIGTETEHTSLEDDQESGNGTSLPQSPSSVEEPKSIDSDFEEGKNVDKCLDLVAMSLCGGLENGNPTDEAFNQNIIKYTEVCQNPAIFSSPDLVVRINGKYYTWIAACPIVMTIVAFQKSLPNQAVNELMNSKPSEMAAVTQAEEIEQEQKRAYSWWYWRRPAGAAAVKTPKSIEKQLTSDNKDGGHDQNAVGTQTSRSNTPDKSYDEKNDSGIYPKHGETESISPIMTDDKLQKYIVAGKETKEKYRKSLRLTTEQIESLNLKNGMNQIVFSVTTAYQGTSRCKCFLFRWKYNDRVVISDIDGTITKSDVLGHILPMVGKDWAQIGVAQLFTKIEENGYKLLYLSARAIGQSKATRDYLQSIRQGDVKLPDGPLLLNPTSLISAFHREVIEKKPEQFKIACLSDIQALFPDKNPFYAGYGNKINDVWAYRAVGIPIMRIFTINTKGELKHELTQTFQSTYCNMTYIVDQLFPPLQGDDHSGEYSNFNYWRDPVADLHIDLALSVPPLDGGTAPTAVGANQVSAVAAPVLVGGAGQQGKMLPTIMEA